MAQKPRASSVAKSILNKFFLAFLLGNSFLLLSQVSAQTSGPTGFSNFENWENVVGSQCALSIWHPSGAHISTATPFTPPNNSLQYVPVDFEAVVGTVPFGTSTQQPPNYYVYYLYVYEGDAVITETDPLALNSNYYIKYTFQNPFGNAVSFEETYANMFA